MQLKNVVVQWSLTPHLTDLDYADLSHPITERDDETTNMAIRSVHTMLFDNTKICGFFNH